MQRSTYTINDTNYIDGELVRTKEEWTLFHHGDWSGNVTIVPPANKRIECSNGARACGGKDFQATEVEIPADIFMQLAKSIALYRIKGELISFLENVE